MKRLGRFIILACILFCDCSNEKSAVQNSESPITPQAKIPSSKYVDLIKALEPFFEPMGEPKADEWLASFQEEGQTFEQYLNQNPTVPIGERTIIYILPLGKFSAKDRQAIKLTADFMADFFNLKVKTLPEQAFEKPLSLKNYRIHPQWKIKQIRTGYVLDEILKPNLPTDAAAFIAFTNEDLFPDKNMNYVFGQANLVNRVGIWSLYRLRDDADNEKFLIRTLKVGLHETGHMFSFYHCTKYVCVMSGANHLGESDNQPLDTCPECTAKICWMTDCKPDQRFEKLSNFSRKNGLTEEAGRFLKKQKAVQTVK